MPFLEVCAAVGALALVVMACAASVVAVVVVRTHRGVRAKISQMVGSVRAARELVERADKRVSKVEAWGELFEREMRRSV